MKSSGRNDGPLVSLEVDLRLLAVFKIWAYVEAAFVEAFAKFGDDVFSACQRGLSLKLWSKCKELLFCLQILADGIYSLYIRETKTKLFCFSASYRLFL